MGIIIEISKYIVPVFIGLVMIVAIKEKIRVFDIFIEGAKDGIDVVWKLIPTFIGIFFSIVLLNKSGALMAVTRGFTPIFKAIGFPSEIVPLALIRPVSGSGAVGMATDIMKQYGADSYVGIVSSVIMGATETTLYTIAVYTSNLKNKTSKRLLVAALIADFAGIAAAVVICRIMSNGFC